MPAIRQQISIAASPRTVWSALTTPEGLTSWWVDDARVDPRVGGRVVLTSTDELGEPLEERGIFLDFSPTRRIEIAWDKLGAAPSSASRVQFQLARAGGETRLSVVVSGGDSLDDDETFDTLTRDWKASLKALRSSLEQG
ncbi:MAG: SRPBCC domain-containing protein [Deltaproteobacteria bacterium]|nr:MAG: SRPBCC domain-containing protein [Deltaproteobacteria bacterium]